MDPFELVVRLVVSVVGAILKAVESGDDILDKRLRDILPRPLKSELARLQAEAKASQKFQS